MQDFKCAKSSLASGALQDFGQEQVRYLMRSFFIGLYCGVQTARDDAGAEEALQGRTWNALGLPILLSVGSHLYFCESCWSFFLSIVLILSR